MSTTESALPATPEAVEAPASATPELETGILTDAQMTELFGDDYKPETTTTAPVKSDTAPAAETAPAADPAADSELLDTAALEALDTPEAEKPGTAVTPPASDFVSRVTQAIPDQPSLNVVVDIVQRHAAFEQAMQSGNLNDALKAMPQAQQLIQGALAQYLANPENENRIVENFVRKHSPENQNPQIEALKAELAEVKNRFAAQDQQQLTAKQQRDHQANVEAQQAAIGKINTEVSSLFDKVRFTANEADRKIVVAMFRNELAADPTAMQNALAGKLEAIRPIFKKVVSEFATIEKAKAGARIGSGKTPPAPVLTGAGTATATPPATGRESAYARAAEFVASLSK